MHLSSNPEDLLYKCTILTAMMRRLTRILFGHTFSKLTFQVNKNNHKNVVKRGMYRMRRLILVFAIRKCYKCHFSCTRTAQLDPGHTACVTKFFVDSSLSKNCLCERRRLYSKSKGFLFEHSIISVCICSRIKCTFLLTKLNVALCLHPPRT